MNQERRVTLIRAAAAITLACAAAPASVCAQAWPSRTITWMYPFGESAATAWVRTLAQEMSKSLGQAVVVENRPGMGGRIGFQQVMAAKPDGYMISIVVPSMVAYQPLTSPTFKIEPGKSYTPITQIYNLKLNLYGSNKLPYKDLAGLVAYAKANPGKLNFGSTGTASTGHFAMEMINRAAGVQMVHVPYKGEGDQTAAAIAGDLHMFITSAGPKSNVEAGRIAVFATTGDTRSKVFPNVPTAKEQGVDFVMTQWMGIAAPAGLPADIVARLNQAITAAMKEPQPVKAAEVAGVEPTPGVSPDAFAALVRADLKALEPIVKATGIVTD
jgi:tripartite-type tricarboxylate transporter receptor subunit TctC